MKHALLVLAAFVPALASGAESAGDNYFVDGHRVSPPAVQKSANAGAASLFEAPQGAGTTIAPTSVHSGFSKPLTLRAIQPMRRTAGSSAPAGGAGSAVVAAAPTATKAPDAGAQGNSSGGTSGSGVPANYGVAALNSFVGGLSANGGAGATALMKDAPGIMGGLPGGNSALAAASSFSGASGLAPGGPILSGCVPLPQASDVSGGGGLGSPLPLP